MERGRKGLRAPERAWGRGTPTLARCLLWPDLNSLFLCLPSPWVFIFPPKTLSLQHSHCSRTETETLGFVVCSAPRGFGGLSSTFQFPSVGWGAWGAGLGAAHRPGSTSKVTAGDKPLCQGVPGLLSPSRAGKPWDHFPLEEAKPTRAAPQPRRFGRGWERGVIYVESWDFICILNHALC